MNYSIRFCFYVGISILLCSLLSCNQDELNAPSDFQIEDGFALTLVASEPTIKDPVDIEFDEYGDAYVLEMPGYPFEDQQSRIIKLEDEDGDGLYESGITYAEDLQLASSILPYKEGMLVAAPPYLLFIKDADKDGIAEIRDTLLDGFSTGNLQHNYNGLSYGLDNWIYAANGGNSGRPFWYGDSTTVIDLKGDDLRINLDDHIIERLGHSSGGYELAINEWGHIFETHNLEHLSQLVFPSRYIEDTKLSLNHTLTNISDHEENGLARIYPIGEQESRVNHPEQSGYFSGACGVTYYGGGALGDTYDQTVWVADVVLNLLHIDKIVDHGAQSTGERVLKDRDFLASTDRSFRPVNMTVGPDGSMYLVDMYREVIEHPEWIPDEMEAKLDLEAGKDKGRIYKITSASVTPHNQDDIHLTSINGAILSLNHENQWVRNTAHRLIMDEKLDQTSISKLEKLATGENAYASLHSMWILNNHELLSIPILSNNLSHSHAGIRENALRIAENYLTEQSVLDKVITLINDDDQRVRLQAGLTLSTMSQTAFKQHQEEILIDLYKSTNADLDQWNIMSIVLAAQNGKLELYKKIAQSEINKQKEELIVALALATSSKQEDAVTILANLSDNSLSDDIKEKIVSSISSSISRDAKSKAILSAISKIEYNTTNLSLITQLTKLRSKLGLSPSNKFVNQSQSSLDLVEDISLDTDQRLDHLRVMELIPYAKKQSILFSLLSNTQPLSIQESALQQIWSSDDKPSGYKLVELWQDLGPQSRRTVSDILLYKELHHDALLSGLESGKINIGEMNFDLERRRTLLWWTDNENTKQRAEALFSDSGVVNRKEVIHKLSPALALKGNKIEGQELFDNLCGQCHLYSDRGHDVGPVLTEINRKSKASLLHDILDPNAAVDTKYINHKLETTNGAIHIGIVDTETDHEISIKKIGGTMITLPKSEIKSLSSLGSSMMPEGLEGNLDEQQMADLLTFLQG